MSEKFENKNDISTESNESLMEEVANLSEEKNVFINNSTYDDNFEDGEEEENLLLPLPTVSDLKLKKYVAKKILDKAKSPQKRTHFNLVSSENKSESGHKQLFIESVQSGLEIEEHNDNVTTDTFLPQPTSSSTPIIKDSESIKNLQKAIIYPDKKKVIENQAKAKFNKNEQTSYNEVFTKSVAKKQFPVAAGIESEKKKELNKNINKEELEEKSEAFSYKIPQNLISLTDDKVVTSCPKPSSNGSSHQNGNHGNLKSITEKLYCDVKTRKRKFENDEIEQQQDESINFQMPSRPTANTDLIDLLAEYRAISLYLLKKLNVDPINFNANDDYINTYKLSRK
ncbi:hypothetical protein PVAND_004992 [Polypedilum vanderplanki]|uniref:Uncharacterized protein n=1 Tax=Polypedilum vanderplanki TaxID=319348 RepID=A0A9J6C0P3_POLVA|nr:hypothetical protein PVAND_004992 [Polypedilum vanderplanki]